MAGLARELLLDGGGSKATARAVRGAVDLRQDRVEGRAAPVAGDENGNVVRMEARMPGRPAPFTRLARQIGPTALEGFKDEGLVRLDYFAQVLGLVGGRSAQKAMAPAKRRRRMHPAKLSRLGQAFAFDHRPGVVEQTLPFVQMRHRRLGERIEGAPASLAAEPRKPMRASRRDERSSRAMGTALVRHPLMAARSQSIRTTPSLRTFLHRPAGRGSLRLSHPPKPAIQIRQGGGHFPALPHAQPSNARKPDGKLIGLHRIKLLKPIPP